MSNRSLGALLGVAVGDALGTTLEFSHPQCPEFPAKMTGPLTDIVGEGPFRVKKGQVTDDTQLAVALAQSLMANHGLNPEDLAKRYKEWRYGAFDCGGQTGGSISSQAQCPEGKRWQGGYENWKHGRRSAGNGSLMRTAPIGVFFAHDAKKRTEASVIDSAITHADPRCMLACSGYNWAIARAIRGARSIYQLFTAAEHGIDAAYAFIKSHPEMHNWYTDVELTQARKDLYSDLCAADKPKPELANMIQGANGFVRTAFRYAFWALRYAEDFREAIIDVVNRGGDADTNGAIAGGLLGAWFGVSGIPETWTEVVQRALSDEPESRWWKDYHPRLMLDLRPLQPVN